MHSGFQIAPKFSENAYERLYCRIPKKNVFWKNHQKSSKMTAVDNLKRSIHTRGLRHVNFYGDGASKGFSRIKNIYRCRKVRKYECVGHVLKRMGTRIRKLRKLVKGLGGKGKLTEKMIDRLQNYSGNEESDMGWILSCMLLSGKTKLTVIQVGASTWLMRKTRPKHMSLVLGCQNRL